MNSYDNRRVIGRAWLMALAAVLLIGCSTSSVSRAYRATKIEKDYDPFTGKTVISMTENQLPIQSDYINSLSLTATKHVEGRGNTQYFLRVYYNGEYWLDLEPGSQMIFLADGERIVLEGLGSYDTRLRALSDMVAESALYPVDCVKLKRIAFAQDVYVRIYGGGLTTIECKLTPVNLSNFQKFVRECCN